MAVLGLFLVVVMGLVLWFAAWFARQAWRSYRRAVDRGRASHACGEEATVVHVPTAPHECNLAQPPVPPWPSKETWAAVGTIQRCNVCHRIWLAEPPIRVSRGQQSACNRWVEISWRRARRIMRRSQP